MEQRTIDLVHSTFCSKQHTHNVEDLLRRQGPDDCPSICYYYIESQVDQEDSMEDHLLWAKEAQEIAGRLAFTSDHEVTEFLYRLGRVVGKVLMLESDYPDSREILRGVLRF